MAGKHAVHVPFLQGIIFQPGNRKMTKQDLVTVGILKIPQKHAFAKISFFRFQVFVRQAVTVNAADAKRLAFYSNIPVLVLQNDCTGVLIQLCDVCAKIVPVFYLMISQGQIDGSNLTYNRWSVWFMVRNFVPLISSSISPHSPLWGFSVRL